MNDTHTKEIKKLERKIHLLEDKLKESESKIRYLEIHNRHSQDWKDTFKRMLLDILEDDIEEICTGLIEKELKLRGQPNL